MSDPDATADWLLSTQGRLARIAAGTLLILIGLGVVGGFLGVILLLIGAVPIASAAYGALLVGPLLGRDTMGRRPEDQPEDKQDDDDEESEDEDDEDRSTTSLRRRGLLRRAQGGPRLERAAARHGRAAGRPGAAHARPARRRGLGPRVASGE